jgi:anti-sigma factor RsiW
MIHRSELTSAYLDGELTASEHTELAEHLSGCGKCSAEMEQLQRVRSAVRSLIPSSCRCAGRRDCGPESPQPWLPRSSPSPRW